MKNLLQTIYVLIFLSGCSDFYHMHYRKLDKISVVGERDGFNACYVKKKNEQTFIPSISGIKKLNSFVETKKYTEAHVTSRHRKYSPFLSVKNNLSKKYFPKVKPNPKFSQQKNNSHANDRRFLIILLLVIIGCVLIGYGVGLVFAVVFGARLYLIIPAIALILLGLLPFAGIVSMVVGDRHHPTENYKEH